MRRYNNSEKKLRDTRGPDSKRFLQALAEKTVFKRNASFFRSCLFSLGRGRGKKGFIGIPTIALEVLLAKLKLDPTLYVGLVAVADWGVGQSAKVADHGRHLPLHRRQHRVTCEVIVDVNVFNLESGIFDVLR